MSFVKPGIVNVNGTRVALLEQDLDPDHMRRQDRSIEQAESPSIDGPLMAGGRLVALVRRSNPSDKRPCHPKGPPPPYE